MLDATPPQGSALRALRDPAPAPAPVAAAAPAAAAAPPAAPATVIVTAMPLARPVGWAAGLLAVAGIIHLVLLPGHLGEARGIGLYFCAIGAAQVVWSLLFALRATRRLAWVGLVALAVQPLGVYVLTRLVRQPFGDHAEDVDLIGIVTGVMELASIVPFAVYLAGTRPAGQTALRGVAVPLALGIAAGLVFAGAVYGIGLVMEDLVPWLDEPEAPHGHEHAAASALDAAAPTGDAADGHSHSHS